MRLAKRLGTWAVVVGGAAAACAPFGNGGSEDTEIQSDAGLPANDAGADADGPPPPDVPVPDAGARFYTRQPFTLCADFDGPSLGEWSDLSRSIDRTEIPGGTLAIESGREGLGVRSALPEGAAEGRMARELRSDGTKDFSLSADVFVKKPTSIYGQGSVTVLGILFGTEAGTPAADAKIQPKDDANVMLTLYARRSAMQSVFSDASGKVLIPYETWVRIRLEARLVGGPDEGYVRVTTSLGGIINANIFRATALGTPVTRALVGLQRYAPASTDVPLEILVDNVVGELL